jgi:FkbM family methyltransferase
VKEKGRGEDPCPVLWETRLGQFWGRADDDKELFYVLQFRLQDAMFLHGPLAIGRRDVVIDGGSHLGTFTRFALQQGAHRVIAFDPDLTNNVCFKRTFRQEIAEGRVVLVEDALWDKPGVLTFDEDPSGLSGAVNHASPDSRNLRHVKQVPATTIDDSVQRLHLNQVSFIKLHIEGAERRALQGARQTISRFHPRLMVSIHHHDDDPVTIPRDIAGLSSAYHVDKHGPHVYGY